MALEAPKDAHKHRGSDMAGPYVLGKTLGKGTSGKVKAAYHKDTGLDVAVKIIKKDYVKTHKQKIAREIAVMRLLEHPHIMKLFDVFETRQHYFIVLERVKGGELFDYIIQKGRLPRKEALRILSQCVQGLEFCHMHSICHRDIKPENLLLDENLNIKFADFGMAQIIPDNHVLGTFCGSPHYGAPEVVSGIPYDGRKSDVWSLGVVFYALVTGMLPFDDKQIPDLLRKVKRGKYTIPTWVDPDIKDLLRRMLNVDVNKRIRTQQIKFHPVFMGKNNINLYFPSAPPNSPALEYMEKHPIESEDDLDETLLEDLEGLGWGTKEELKGALLKKQSPSLHNIEAVFYSLLASRNEERIAQNRAAKNLEPHDEPPVSFRKPPASPHTPGTIRDSHDRRAKDDSEMKRVKSDRAEQVMTGGDRPAPKISVDAGGPAPSSEAPKSKGVSGLSIDTTKTSDDQATGHTPRFHRLSFSTDPNNIPDTPTNAAPVTPTAGKSWFKSIFKRRPSLDNHSNTPLKGAHGLYSAASPDEIVKDLQQVLSHMGINHHISSTNAMEIKCDAKCYLDTEWRLCVNNAEGKTVYKDEHKDKPHEDVPDPAAIRGAVHHPTPQDTSEKVEKDVHKPHTVKFSIEISREASDKVSCVNFNHRSGNLIVYRSVYADVIKLVSL